MTVTEEMIEAAIDELDDEDLQNLDWWQSILPRIYLAMRSKEQNQPVTVAAHPTLPVVVADGELEPCPWCGHAESLEIVDMGQTFGTVHCNGCGCDGPVDDGRPSRAWNTRAKESLPQGDECDRIFAVLRDWRLSTMAQEDEPTEGYPLIDAVSTPGGTIASGEEELGEIAAAISAALVRSKLPIDRNVISKADALNAALESCNHDLIIAAAENMLEALIPVRDSITAIWSQSIEGERARLNAAFSAGWLTRHERPDAQPQDAFEIYWASKDEERHG